jgi:hypothetical protein
MMMTSVASNVFWAPLRIGSSKPWVSNLIKNGPDKLRFATSASKVVTGSSTLLLAKGVCEA